MSHSTTIEARKTPWAMLQNEEAPYAVRRQFQSSEYTFFMDLEPPLLGDEQDTDTYLDKLFQTKQASQLPFNGWIGYLSYDFLAAHAGIKLESPNSLKLPSASFARPQTIVRYKDGLCKISSILAGRCESLTERANATFAESSSHSCEEAVCNLDFEAYKSIFEAAKEYILNGETYQIKISQRYQSRSSIHPLDAFVQLMHINPAPEAFLWHSPEHSLVSCTPESIIRTKGRRISTRPIGGTWERNNNDEEDGLKERFRLNEKENAEHRMLVDLERNDIGKLCEAGSVKISQLAEMETYAHLYHLVTTIEGELKHDMPGSEIIRSMLPGGSISGCPKHHTIQLIDKLEPIARSFYTGSFGTIEDNGDMDLNLMIRTMLMSNESVWIQSGGGIVADSYPEYEYNENAIKARALLELMSSKSE